MNASQTLSILGDQWTAKGAFAKSMLNIVHEGIVPDLTGCWPRTFSDICARFAESPNCAIPAPNLTVADLFSVACSEYRESPSRRSFLEARRNDTHEKHLHRVFAIHQPLLFPGLGVLGLVFLLSALQEVLKNSAQIFFIVNDYDSVESDRFRSLSIPNPNNINDELSLCLPVRGVHRNRLIVNCPEYDAKDFRHFLNQVRSLPSVWNVSRFLEELRDSSRSLTEFNTGLLIEIVNVLSKSPIVFLSGYALLVRLQTAIRKHFMQLVPDFHVFANDCRDRVLHLGLKLDHYVKPLNPNRLPFWTVCGNCRTRVPLFFERERVLARCLSCNRELCDGNLTKLIDSPLELLPTALCQNVLLPTLLQSDFFVGYNGAAEYSLIANYVAQKKGLRTHAFMLLRIYPYYLGLAQRQAIDASQGALRSASTCPAIRGFRRANLTCLDLLRNLTPTEAHRLMCTELTTMASLESPLIIAPHNIRDMEIISSLTRLYNVAQPPD